MVLEHVAQRRSATRAVAVGARGIARGRDRAAARHLRGICGSPLPLLRPRSGVVPARAAAGAQNTLPIWIFGNIRLGQQLPQVNVVVLFVIAITLVPVALAARLTRDTGLLRAPAARAKAPAQAAAA